MGFTANSAHLVSVFSFSTLPCRIRLWLRLSGRHGAWDCEMPKVWAPKAPGFEGRGSNKWRDHYLSLTLAKPTFSRTRACCVNMIESIPELASPPLLLLVRGSQGGTQTHLHVHTYHSCVTQIHITPLHIHLPHSHAHVHS